MLVSHSRILIIRALAKEVLLFNRWYFDSSRGFRIPGIKIADCAETDFQIDEFRLFRRISI
jgi:hypothetical protein